MGRLVNGGAWLTVEDQRVDLLYRDLDVVQHWLDEAEAGRYEVDQVEGYLAGMATYVLAGELALAELREGCRFPMERGVCAGAPTALAPDDARSSEKPTRTRSLGRRNESAALRARDTCLVHGDPLAGLNGRACFPRSNAHMADEARADMRSDA